MMRLPLFLFNYAKRVIGVGKRRIAVGGDKREIN